MAEEEEKAAIISTEDEKPKLLSEDQFLVYLAERIRRIEQETTRVINIIGGAGAGKTTLASKLCDKLGSGNTLGTDDYLIGSRAYRHIHFKNRSPVEKYDRTLLNNHIKQITMLKENEFLFVPKYDDLTGLAVDEKKYKKKIGKIEYLIIEGDFDFVEDRQLLIYFDVPDEVRLNNRIIRDVQKGRETNINKIEEMFCIRQESYHIPYVLPCKKKAEIVVEVQAKKTKNGFEYKYLIKENVLTKY